MDILKNVKNLNNFKRSFKFLAIKFYMSGENHIIQKLTRTAEISKTRKILIKFEFGLIIFN